MLPVVRPLGSVLSLAEHVAYVPGFISDCCDDSKVNLDRKISQLQPDVDFILKIEVDEDLVLHAYIHRKCGKFNLIRVMGRAQRERRPLD